MEYEAYLKQVMALVQKKFFLGQQRLNGEESQKLAAEIIEDNQKLYETEALGMGQEDFWAMAYLLRIGTYTEFERHLIFLLFCHALWPECSDACRVLNGRPEQNYVTIKAAVLTFEREITFVECYVLLSENSLFCKIFLDRDKMEESRAERKLVLDDRILHLIITKSPIYPQHQNFLKIFYPEAVVSEDFGQDRMLSGIKNILS